MPVTQGNKIRTGDDGRAEVEFEDGSALRMTPNTVLEFPQLSLRDSGGKVSTINIQQGTAYVNFAGKDNNEFALNFGREKLAMTHPAHLRIEMGDAQATVAMFKGEASVQTPSETVEIGKKQTATFDLANQDTATVAKNLEQDPYDSWDKQQNNYQDRYSNNGYSAYSPYAYGTSDLNYYGRFFNAPGYGYVWQPYFAGAGWDPYANGAWMWYPGYGYSWVSAYPWGWTPYHYGSWLFVPSYGWMWQPGGSWAGWNSVPRVVNPPANFQLPHPPTTGHSTIVVNRGPVTGGGTTGNKVIVRSGSAGLGIPRGSVRDLGRVQRQVTDRGAVTATVHPAPVPRPAAVTSGMTATRPAATGAPRISSPAPHTSVPRPAPHSASPHHASTPHK
jgi:hypothetical protein